MKPNPKLDRTVLWVLFTLIVVIVFTAALLSPGLMVFRRLTLTEFVLSVLPLVMVALFIERALEVILTPWRAQHTTELRERAGYARLMRSWHQPRRPEEEAYIDHQHRTQRIAFVCGTACGVILAALGIRVLEMFVDHAIFYSLPPLQQHLFRATDVALSGAVLGGGSDALHQLMLVFTNFFQSAAGRVKQSGPTQKQHEQASQTLTP